MHWLAEEIHRLHGLSATAQRAAGPASGAAASRARNAFLDAVRTVVREVARRSGVTACFACHDGLVLERAGRAPDFDALSAMTQACTAAGADAASALALGRVQQMLVIGDEHKLALFVIGQLAVGILSPAGVNLAQALAHTRAHHEDRRMT
jgi:predicted regulator of Ras-like GTPase activity (Roadblock/LC7/MglB family)